MRSALQYDMTGLPTQRALAQCMWQGCTQTADAHVIPALKDALMRCTYQLGATEKRSESRPGVCCSVISIPLKSP